MKSPGGYELTMDHLCYQEPYRPTKYHIGDKIKAERFIAVITNMSSGRYSLTFIDAVSKDPVYPGSSIHNAWYTDSELDHFEEFVRKQRARERACWEE